MINNLFTDYQRNLLIYNAWIDLLEDITEVNRSVISEMTDIFSFYEMPDEFLYAYLKFYGYDIEQELKKSEEINRNAISRFRYLIQNRGTKSALESVFKTSGQLYSTGNDIKVEIFFDGMPLYLNENYRYTRDGFIEYSNIEDDNTIVPDDAVIEDYDATIVVILENGDVDETSKIIQSIKPAGTKFEIVSQTGFSWAYDSWTYSIEEEFRGKYEKEVKYNQSAFLNVENDEGTAIIDRKPYHKEGQDNSDSFSDKDDKWYGISEKDKRKVSWTVYDDSNVNLYYMPNNGMSPRPCIKDLDSTTDDLPEGWNADGYTTVSPLEKNVIASYPTLNGSSNSLSIWDDVDVFDIDTSEDLLTGEFINPVIMGNCREFYSQGSSLNYTSDNFTNDIIVNDISVILNNDINNFGVTVQFPTVIYNCNSNPIFHNITRYESGETNLVQFSNKSRRFTNDNWKNYIVGAYNAYDKIYYVTIKVPAGNYIIVDDLEEGIKTKYNAGDDVVLKPAKGGFFSKEFGYFKDELNSSTSNDEWNEFVDDEKTVSTISETEDFCYKGFCRVEDFASSSWIDNLGLYEVQFYHSIEPESSITPEMSIYSLYNGGETILSLNFDNTLVDNPEISVDELVHKFSFGTVRGNYWVKAEGNDFSDFFGTLTGFYKVDKDNNRVVIPASIYIPCILDSEICTTPLENNVIVYSLV